jgi:6,7-dimethyl-8-ribityllumazine synthase
VAGNERAEGSTDPELDGRGLRVTIVCSRFNDRITRRLLDGARRRLHHVGVADGDVSEVWVPGAFELPLAAQVVAGSGRADAVICLGAVIRGDTTHFEIVSEQCAGGIARVGLDTGVPVIFGVLTTEDVDQALARSEDEGGHNVGDEGAAAAVEMACLLADLRAADNPPAN